MVRRRLIWRIVRLIVISCCVLVVATFATVQVGQRVLRHRAEQLKLDLLHLQVGKSSLSEMQVLMARWGKYGKYEGSCTAQKCDYRIELSDWLGDTAFKFETSSLPLQFLNVPLFWTATVVHWHIPSVDAEASMEAGTVKSWRLHVMTAVPKGYGPGWRFGGPPPDVYTSYSSGEYALIAEIRAQDAVHQDSPWPTQNLHPNYAAKEPGRCMNCIEIWTELGPSATATEISQMSNVNLDCLTRWSPCTQETDIFPDAWKVYLRDRSNRMDMYQRLEECKLSVEEMAAGSDSIIRLHILAANVNSERPILDTIISARLESTLRGVVPLRAGQVIQFVGQSEYQKPEQKYVAGEDVFMFNAEVEEDHSSPIEMIGRPECAVIPANSENAIKLKEFLAH